MGTKAWVDISPAHLGQFFGPKRHEPSDSIQWQHVHVGGSKPARAPLSNPNPHFHFSPATRESRAQWCDAADGTARGSTHRRARSPEGERPRSGCRRELRWWRVGEGNGGGNQRQAKSSGSDGESVGFLPLSTPQESGPA
jgi:hypothetical protein